MKLRKDDPGNGDVDEENGLGLCGNCLKLLNIHAGRMKVRTYGEIVCICGRTSTRKSPTQLFHPTVQKRHRETTLAGEAAYHLSSVRQISMWMGVLVS